MSLKTYLHLLCVLLIPAAVQSQTINGTGSDLFDEELQQAMVQAFTDQGLQLSFKMAGSLQGWRDVQSGASSFALVATADSVPVNRQLEQYPVAFQVAKFAVHTTNPLQSISYSQLASLYALGGTLSDWRTLVSDPDWANRKILPAALRSPNSMAIEVFSAEVIKGDDFKREIRFSADAEQLSSIFVQSPNALILLPAMPEGRNFRFLAVNTTDSGQAYGPGPDNVFFGDYALRLPFYLVLAADLVPERRAAIIRAVFSDSVVEAFEKAYFLPVPQAERDTVLSQIR